MEEYIPCIDLREYKCVKKKCWFSSVEIQTYVVFLVYVSSPPLTQFGVCISSLPLLAVYASVKYSPWDLRLCTVPWQDNNCFVSPLFQVTAQRLHVWSSVEFSPHVGDFSGRMNLLDFSFCRLFSRPPEVQGKNVLVKHAFSGVTGSRSRPQDWCHLTVVDSRYQMWTHYR